MQNPNNPMMQGFQQFMQQMQGRNPQQIINELVSSGRLSQEQLNAVQQRANQITPMLNGFKSKFGF